MKKALSIMLLTLLLVGLAGCGGQKTDKNEMVSVQELQGFWYEETGSGLLMGFNGEEYILYGFGTQISLSGTFEVDDQGLILHTDGIEDKIYESVKIKNDILTLKTPEGDTTRWEKISEDEVRYMLENE